MLIMVGLDVRFGWSPSISLGFQIGGLALVALGNLLGAWAAAANKFYIGLVRIQKDYAQRVRYRLLPGIW